MPLALRVYFGYKFFMVALLCMHAVHHEVMHDVFHLKLLYFRELVNVVLESKVA